MAHKEVTLIQIEYMFQEKKQKKRANAIENIVIQALTFLALTFLIVKVKSSFLKKQNSKL